MDIESMFSGMAKAQMNGKGSYMNEGQYLVRSKVLKVKEGFKGRSVIFEFEILESSSEQHAVGSTGSWVIKLDKPQAFGDLKALIFALAMQIEPSSVKSPDQDADLHNQAADIMKAALDPAAAKKLGEEPDFLIGLPVKLECTKIRTQKGGDFTVHRWSPVTEEAETKTAA